MKVSIIYYSSTGNTKAMAEYIAQGVKEKIDDVIMKDVSEATLEDVLSSDVVLLGCSAMGAEVLEETMFEPFVESILDKISGKNIALFGSYGWGDGQWMREWTERMQVANATLIEESLIVNEFPDTLAVEKCIVFGRNAVN